MEFKLHGVRCSIPVPSKEALKYGGNTTCIEISDNSFQLIIDLGSGFQNVKIRKNIPKFIVFSHFHHDHTQGLPFNSAVFDPDNQFHISSALLNRKEITIDKIMSNLDKDLKKVFELPFLFKN